LLNGFKEETELCIWSSIADSLRDIGRICEEIGSFQQWKMFVASLMEQAAARLGKVKKENEDPNLTLMRNIFYSMMSKTGDKSYLEDSVAQIESNKPLDTDLKSIIISNYLSQTGEAGLKKIIALHGAATMTEEKNSIEKALGGSTKVDQVLEYILDSAVRNQDKSDALLSVAARGKTNRDAVLNLTFSKIDFFKSLFDGVQIGRYLKMLLSLFSTRADYQKIKSFFSQNPIKNAERSIRQGK